MQKVVLCLLLISICAGTITSCNKSSLPPPTNNPPPPPEPAPPPPPELPDTSETEPAILEGVTYDVSANIKGYYKAIPAKYSKHTNKFPVIISFHGGGQYGNGSTDLPLILDEGIPKLLRDNKFPPSFMVNGHEYSFIVIAPQFVRKVANSEIETLVNHIKSTFRVDSSRIYLSGLSLGARALSDYAAYKPDEIAAVAAMGGLPQIDKNLASKCSTMANADLPVWQFHNKNDSAWLYSEAKRYIEVFMNMKPAIAPRFTTFEIGEGRLSHDCWTRTVDPEYREDGKNIYEWMLGYKR